MSDEPTPQDPPPEPEPSTPPPLPDAPAPEVNTASYPFPNILLGIGRDGNGFTARQVREEEIRQVEYRTTVEYAEEPAPPEAWFTLRGMNHMRFGGNMVALLNDAIDLGDLKMPASSPSASEYLALIGQPVTVHFQCTRDNAQSKRRGKPTYRIARTQIVLL